MSMLLIGFFLPLLCTCLSTHFMWTVISRRPFCVDSTMNWKKYHYTKFNNKTNQEIRRAGLHPFSFKQWGFKVQEGKSVHSMFVCRQRLETSVLCLFLLHTPCWSPCSEKCRYSKRGPYLGWEMVQRIQFHCNSNTTYTVALKWKL